MTTAPSDPLIGRLIEGRYEIISRIARGGMAVVYLANDTRLHRRVAIKVMHPHLAEDDEFKYRFEQEARNAARLTHPNLVSVLDQGEEQGIVYLVMEYLPGITLRELLKEQRFLTAEQTLEISEAVLSGLTAAHASGIIHRDLKPENVLLADDGRVKLADFGLARAASASTSTGQALLGTIAYLSPELVTRGTANKQSDVYAFGIMMYEMLTGQQPFTGDQPMQIAYQHAHDDVPAPSLISKESSAEFDRVVQWATTKDPDARPADAAELLRAVQSLSVTPSPQHATRVLATGDLTTRLPDSITAAQQPLAAPEHEASEELPPLTPAQRMPWRERRSARRGAVLLILTLVLAVIAGTIGWWFGNGPGSLIGVPKLNELSAEQAVESLDELGLLHELTECDHLEIAPGHVVSTSPSAGSRVERETVITLCMSTGPRLLGTPDNLLWVSLSEAEARIEEAGFKFGEVVEHRFTEVEEGMVIAAETETGEALPDELHEQSVINLVLSAGEIPPVYALSEDDAIAALEQVGLTLDESLFLSEYSDDVEADHAIAVVVASEPVSVGDAVGLRMSLGPELFEVPPVEGMTVRQAIQALNDLGFDARAPWYLLDEALDSFNASGTNPSSGTLVPKGSRVDVTPRIF